MLAQKKANVSHDLRQKNTTRITKQGTEESTNTENQLSKLICTQLALKQRNWKQLPTAGLAQIKEHDSQTAPLLTQKLGRAGDDLNMCSRIPLTSKFTVARWTSLIQVELYEASRNYRNA